MSNTLPRQSVGRRAALALALAFAILATLAGTSGALTPERGRASAMGHTWTRVIVRSTDGSDAAADAVRRRGGRVTSPLPFVDGVAAELPFNRVGLLSGDRGIQSVTENSRITFDSYSFGEEATASAFVGSTGAGSAWTTGNQGAGVGVAVIDTGTSPMADFAGRLVHGPDLSGEGNIFDTFGHGTVMAGLVAGSGAASSSNGRYTGMAPKAHVVSVKVAGRNGVADVSTVLQAMHWVSAYKDQYNIRVLNLSWGTSSVQSPTLDPLNYAVERLWQQGIVVVVAAGNSGPDALTIRKPGDDPMVLTVGAYDDRGNTNTSDDHVPKWTSRGPTSAGYPKPDVAAPGRTLIALRSFGSTVEFDNPKALVSPAYIKGSGSSQASAVTAGAAALLVAARPSLTPDQVKALLTKTASPIPFGDPLQQGSGRISVAAAMTADPGPASWQTPVATGLGSLELSRGGRTVSTDCNDDGVLDVIVGDLTAQCATWDPAKWTGGTWTGGTWTGGTWTGGTWTGGTWTGTAWAGGTWTGGTWTTNDWTGGTWTGGTWTGGTWTGGTWTGGTWTGGTWTGNEYGDEEANQFLTAFWGNRPPYWVSLPGETSDPAPGKGTAGAAPGAEHRPEGR
ncbi:MAG TPA: S8 family serine peptidase [Mycobacteriales bacterium]|nr:S8 family serine peptidase [Mycobacteriales bacterium]